MVHEPVELLTTKEAAALFRRSTKWLLRMSGEGRIPLRPIRSGNGANLLWRRRDFDRCIEQMAVADDQ